jgi:hypothetical protein
MIACNGDILNFASIINERSFYDLFHIFNMPSLDIVDKYVTIYGHDSDNIGDVWH